MTNLIFLLLLNDSHLNCGTLNGLRPLLTIGISPGLGSAGVLAHKAADVSCETNEKLLSCPVVVLKTRFNRDLSPVDATGTGDCVGISFPWSTFAANSGSLPHRQDDDFLSMILCLENLSMISEHT